MPLSFFFSSRRRHTRLQGDWSSDVCSSDLEYRSITSDINSSILANRLRTLFAFITAPLVVAFQSENKSSDAGSIPPKRSGHLRPTSGAGGNECHLAIGSAARPGRRSQPGRGGRRNGTWANLARPGGGFRSRGPTAPVRGAPALRGVDEPRPIPRDLLLRLSQIHVSALHLRGQVVLDHIFLLEIALSQRTAGRTALRPNVLDGVGSTHFQRNQMVQFADLVSPGIAFGMLDSVTAIHGRPIPLGRRAVSDTAGAEELVPKNLFRRTASVTIGLIAPGVHVGSGSGSPLRVWTRHGARLSARPSGRDARGFTDSTGQAAQVTLALAPASS